jgi:GTP:adenosylcobinamide-phosphate guanylyltransferase
MDERTEAFTGIVLAADRGPDDPVARFVGSPCKSLAPIGGKPMVLRVLDALAEAREIDSLVVCGPSKTSIDREPELLERITAGKVRWIENQATPSSSTYHALGSLSSNVPALVTTSDHALLNSEMVDYFCCQARLSDCDVIVALAPYEQVMRAYPQTKRTATTLRDGCFCSCNLFAFLTPQARSAAQFWQKCERQRKKPWKMLRILGWTDVIRYLLRRMTLAEGLNRLSVRMNIKAGAVMMPFPEAAVDVDTVKDLHFVEKIVGSQAL